MPYFAGHFKVLKKISENTFEVQIPQPAPGKRIHPVFNASKLRRFHSQRPYIEAMEDECTLLVFALNEPGDSLPSTDVPQLP